MVSAVMIISIPEGKRITCTLGFLPTIYSRWSKLLNVSRWKKGSETAETACI